MAVGAIIGAVGSIAGAGLNAASSSGAFGGGGGGKVHTPEIKLQPYDYLNLQPVTGAFGDFLNQESSIPGLENFSSFVNDVSNTAWQQELEKLDPSLLNTVSTLGANANSLAKGLIPQDVKASIEESTAQAAWRGGYAGTSLGSNLTARSLGLTSLALENQGAADTGTEMNLLTALNPSQMNASDLLFSPQQILQRADEQQQYNTDLQDQVEFANQGAAFGTNQTNAQLSALGAGNLGKAIASIPTNAMQYYNAYNALTGGNSANPNAATDASGNVTPGYTDTYSNSSALQADLQNAQSSGPLNDIYGTQGLGLT